MRLLGEKKATTPAQFLEKKNKIISQAFVHDGYTASGEGPAHGPKHKGQPQLQPRRSAEVWASMTPQMFQHLPLACGLIPQQWGVLSLGNCSELFLTNQI